MTTPTSALILWIAGLVGFRHFLPYARRAAVEVVREAVRDEVRATRVECFSAPTAIAECHAEPSWPYALVLCLIAVEIVICFCVCLPFSLRKRPATATRLDAPAPVLGLRANQHDELIVGPNPYLDDSASDFSDSVWRPRRSR